MGKYSPIWNTLKDKGKVSLAIPLAAQDRVIKGVIKTKDEDLVRKLMLSNSRKREKLTITKQASKVTITLVTYDILKDIQLMEL